MLVLNNHREFKVLLQTFFLFQVQEIDKRLVKYIEQFKNKLNASDAREAQDDDNVSEANSESSADLSQ